MVIECSHGRIHVLKSMGGSVTFVHPSRLPLLRFPPPFTVQSLTCKYPSSVPCVVFLWIPFPSESEARVLGEMQIKNCWKQSLRVSERTRIPRRPEIKFLRVYQPRWPPPPTLWIRLFMLWSRSIWQCLHYLYSRHRSRVFLMSALYARACARSLWVLQPSTSCVLTAMRCRGFFTGTVDKGPGMKGFTLYMFIYIWL